MSEIKNINSEEELKAYIHHLANQERFFPNQIIYSGKIGFVYGSLFYQDNGKEFVEDYFHRGYYFPIGSGRNIYKIAKVYRLDTKLKFSTKNSDTWLRFEIVRVREGVRNAETQDIPLCNSLEKRVFTKIELDGTRAVIHTDEEMKALGFVKGTINEDFWFLEEEKESTDNMLPYKKFDNTYYKQSVEGLKEKFISDGMSPSGAIKEIAEIKKKNIKFGVESPTYLAFEGITNTFGVEIETCIGRLEEKDFRDLNIKAVHDGSLRDEAGNTPGGEYVTGILKGDAGLAQLSEICRVLASKCKVNSLCGVHVHIGGMDWNKEDIVYCYILAELIEDELFSMLPKSRRTNIYCRRLTQLTLHYLPRLREANTQNSYNILIDEIYNEIFKEVTIVKGKRVDLPRVTDSESLEPSISSRNNNRQSQHPLGAKCGYDKNSQRYCWLNFVTLLYNTKGKKGSNTLEARPHSATMNFTKIKNWVKLFFAFCRFVEIGKSDIKKGKVTLEQIIKVVYPKTGEELIKYIEERKELFKNHDESVDYIDITEKKSKTIKEVVTT